MLGSSKFIFIQQCAVCLLHLHACRYHIESPPLQHLHPSFVFAKQSHGFCLLFGMADEKKPRVRAESSMLETCHIV